MDSKNVSLNVGFLKLGTIVVVAFVCLFAVGFSADAAGCAGGTYYSGNYGTTCNTGTCWLQSSTCVNGFQDATQYGSYVGWWIQCATNSSNQLSTTACVTPVGGTCKQITYDASLNTYPTQQGWAGARGSANSDVTFGQDGAIKYLRLNVPLASGGISYSQPLSISDVQGRAWTAEIWGRFPASYYNPPTVDIDMLIVSDGSRQRSLYSGPTRTGVLGPRDGNGTLQYSRVIYRDNTAQFRKYKMVHYANNTLDVMEDGVTVISGVSTSEMYPPVNETGSNGNAIIYFGIGSSSGSGIMDVASIKFIHTDCNNTANLTATCTASPNPANINQSVTFTPTVSGGTGTYT
ncbi:TPA: hypothetical protein H1009_01380, partial [archaeon]|nr:hypothetical protein [Candidatus Naiadarchaeales archaeon SRR2090153.bin461]